MNKPNEYKQIVINIANMNLGAEKKATDIFNNYHNLGSNDVDSYYIGKFIITEIISELKFNQGAPDRIRFWILVLDFYISKYNITK